MSQEVLRRIRERAQRDPIFREELLNRPRTILQEYDLSPEEQLQVLVPNFSWLIEGKLAGLSQPRSDDAFVCLIELGISSLVSLTEQALPDGMLEKFGFRSEHIPITDFTAPTVSQIEQAVAVIDEYLEAGLIVGVHCGAGLGRTGTILAGYLVRQGSSAEVAITTVRAKRPGSIETLEQETAIRAYEQRNRSEGALTKAQ
jgi:atypical dual specificity phosphatase